MNDGRPVCKTTNMNILSHLCLIFLSCVESVFFDLCCLSFFFSSLSLSFSLLLPLFHLLQISSYWFPPSVLHWPPLRLKQRLNYWISVASLLFSCARICFLSFALTIPLSSFLPLEFNLFQRNCFIAFRPNPKPLGITCVFVCVFLFGTKPHVSFCVVLGYFNVTSFSPLLPFSFSSQIADGKWQFSSSQWPARVSIRAARSSRSRSVSRHRWLDFRWLCCFSSAGRSGGEGAL